jgi:MtaA/CmuA family methyltransferase
MNDLNGLVFPINALPSCRMVSEGIDRISCDAEVKSEAVSRYYARVDADLLFFFSDIVIQAEAMGAKIRFAPDAMPCVMEKAREVIVTNPSKSPRMGVNAQALRRLACEFPHKLKSTLVYGPFTVAGQVAGEQNVLRGTIDRPDAIQHLLEKTLQCAMDYGRYLLDAGADVLWVSDPLAALLPPERFSQFAGDYLARLFAMHSGPTVLHICGDTAPIVDAMIETGVKGISFDQCMDLPALEDMIPGDVTIIGNLDPVEVVEMMSAEEVAVHTADLVALMGIKSNYALSTGCALPPSTPIENVVRFTAEGRSRLADLSPQSEELWMLAETVHKGERDAVPELVDRALGMGISPGSIIRSGLMRAVRKASGRYELKTCFLPEILLIVDAFYKGYQRLESHVKSDQSDTPQIALGTVKGDLHEIGKDLVAIMLEANGVKVMDLGVDVDGTGFTEAVRTFGMPVVGLSAFTTAGRKQLSRIIEQFRREGLSHVSILIGGAAVNAQTAKSIGASGYGRDAMEAVKLVEKILKRSGALYRDSENRAIP